MITISKYGIQLVQLSQDKIELVRKWRNSDKIKKYMEYKDYISPEMQQKWFDKISNTTNDFFFIIIENNKEVGLVNIKNVEWSKRIGEWGVFVWDDLCLHNGTAYKAALRLYEFAFNVLHLDNIEAHIINNNIRSIKYHERLGYKLLDNQINVSDKEVNQLYILTKESYIKHKPLVMDKINKTRLIIPPTRFQNRHRSVFSHRKIINPRVLI